MSSPVTTTEAPVTATEPGIADARVRAALEVLGGASVADVAQRYDVAPPLLERWVASFVEAGSRAVAGVETDRQTPERFLTVLAHEFRTPLAAAIAGLRLLGDPRLDTAARREVHVLISNRLSQLSVLCGDVLDAASVVLGRLSLQLAEVDLRAAVDAVVATNGDLRLKHVPGPARSVVADRRRVEQVIAGLLDSALRHGTGPVRITVTSERTQVRLTATSHARVAVSPERARSWLEPFDAANDTGNGLGLYVVRSLTLAHGGTAGLDSSRCREGGTDQDLHFWVRLPLGGPALAAAPTSQE